MNAPAEDENQLCTKIARLVQEKGWNQDEFARLAQLNRLTVRNILQGAPRRLHNATVSACARVLGFSVHDLRTIPLDALLSRLPRHAPSADPLRRQFDQATQPEVTLWLERNPERAAQFSAEELDELYSLQGTGGPLTSFGVIRFVEQIERRRRLLQKVNDLVGTEMIDLLEPLIDLMHEKIQPYRSRLGGTGAADSASGGFVAGAKPPSG
jgi:transcriptional regulator with XRE-family HTH domain